jgi:PAS domain-containing protein
MILRHWLGRLLPGREPLLLGRLREALPGVRAAGLIDFTYGFRHEAGRTTVLALSNWPDFDTVQRATGGELDGTIRALTLEDLFESSHAETYERLPPAPGPLADAGGRVIGVVTGRVRPQHERSAQEMVDRSAVAALGAGAVAAQLGRRLVGGVTEMIVVVIWPRREAMARFVRSRDIPAIDPAFTSHLVDWRFETYNALSPERLLIPAEGPALLVIDRDGRYVDATPSVEDVLGIPGEMLYGRSVLDLGSDEAGRADLARRFLGARPDHGYLDLRRPDGRVVRVGYRIAVETPGQGLSSILLAIAGQPVDRRSVEVIVAEALGIDPDAAPAATPILDPAETGA